jgi:hypothetical protein
VDFGAKFLQDVENIHEEYQLDIKERCVKFLIQLVHEVQKRLPESKHTPRNIQKPPPTRILFSDQSPTYEQLPFKEFIPEVDRSKVESQLRLIKHVNWEESLFEDGVPEDPVKFWAQVRLYERNEEKVFLELSNYALSVYSLPCSNAFVERIFSTVTFLKDKYANRMNVDMLDSLLTIKTHLQAVFYYYYCVQF